MVLYEQEFNVTLPAGKVGIKFNKHQNGFEITKVEEDSPNREKLKERDVIIYLDGVDLSQTTRVEFEQMFRKRAEDEKTITIARYITESDPESEDEPVQTRAQKAAAVSGDEGEAAVTNSNAKNSGDNNNNDDDQDDISSDDCGEQLGMSVRKSASELNNSKNGSDSQNVAEHTNENMDENAQDNMDMDVDTNAENAVEMTTNMNMNDASMVTDDKQQEEILNDTKADKEKSKSKKKKKKSKSGALTAAATCTPCTPATPALLCDICDKPDGHAGLNMQQCIECGVCVHELCYCLVNEKDDDEGMKYKDWKCHACTVVGKAITVSREGEKHKEVIVKSRPVRCAFCPIATGLHAMHPLYDKHGFGGRPLLTKSKSKSKSKAKAHKDKDGNIIIDEELTIVWAHTICALIISNSPNSGGLVYGCNMYGSYEYYDFDEDDKRNMKHLPAPPLDLTFNGKDGTPLLSALPNHFVIAYDDGSKGALMFMERLKDFRDLQCCVCRKNDVGSRRIPLQCVYGDCAVSTHVGCAKWGAIAAGGVSRISFFPGDEESDPVSKMYCSQHLKIARINKPSVDANDDSSESDDDFDNAALIDDTAGEIFDDEVDEPRLRPGEEHFAKRKRDKHSSSLSDDFDLKNKGKSAYHEKKRLIQQTAKAMLVEYENELKAGKSFERVDKNLSGHWKKQVTKDVFKKSIERIDLKLVELKDKYALEDAAIGLLQEEEEPAGRWSNLWVPHFTTPLELEWDTYESCSESEI